LLWLTSFRVDAVWADCEETLADTRRYFMPRRRQLHVVPMFRTGADEPHKVSYAVQSPLRVAAAGRLVGRKNFPLAIEAIGLLRPRGIRAKLDIFGDGPEMDALRDLVTGAGLEEAVTLAGYRADWAREAIEHDIFVNLSDTEGFCIVVAEALAAGLPVIATPVGGIKEYGRPGENIVFLHRPDASRLADEIEQLANNDARRTRLGMQARRDMIEQFSRAAVRARSQSIFGSTFGGALTTA
jgi:glycosyltransferase involved in cell wall biosynthesis